MEHQSVSRPTVASVRSVVDSSAQVDVGSREVLAIGCLYYYDKRVLRPCDHFILAYSSIAM
jgi:hypothetical protein